MNTRNSILLVLAIVAIVAGWFALKGPEPETEEPMSTDARPNQEAVTEEPNQGDGVLDLDIAGDAESAVAEPSIATAGDAIPFASLSVSNLEEIDLSNATEVHSHKIREWRGRIQPALPKLRAKLESEGEDGVIAFSLPDATQINVTRLRYESFGLRQGVFTGKILGQRFGEVVLSYVNQAVAGSIHDYRNENVWEIRNAGSGQQYIAQVDVNALGECGVCKEHVE